MIERSVVASKQKVVIDIDELELEDKPFASYAGQIIMDGYLGRYYSNYLERLGSEELKP
jgi:hypothetical protein